jgi:hypothetical protein
MLSEASALCYPFRVAASFWPAVTVLDVPLCTVFQLFGRVAQLAEHSALNRQVVGSIPTASTKLIDFGDLLSQGDSVVQASAAALAGLFRRALGRRTSLRAVPQPRILA